VVTGLRRSSGYGSDQLSESNWEADEAHFNEKADVQCRDPECRIWVISSLSENITWVAAFERLAAVQN